MNIAIKVDTSKFDKMLAAFPEAIARAHRVALHQIGNTVKNRTTYAFKKEELRPSPWAPRKHSKRDDGHALLRRSTDMFRSIDYFVQEPDTVVIGTKVDYAKYHQFGTKNMPARPFFPLDANGNLLPDINQKIMKKIENAFTAELKKFGR